MMEGEGRGKRLAATACAFTLLFCLAVGLGVHGAFQYQQVKQEQRLSAEYSLKQAQKAAAQRFHCAAALSQSGFRENQVLIQQPWQPRSA